MDVLNKIDDILNVKLDSARIEKSILEKLANNEIIFISNRTRDSLKEYISTKDNLIPVDKVKNLWKNLLIDAITLLKINDSREKLYIDFKKYRLEDKLENKVFIEKFDKIRLLGAFGIDELGNYFDDYTQYESILYGLDSHYRDHTRHVINVWAIGVWFLSKKSISFSDEFTSTKAQDNIDFIFDLMNEDKLTELEMIKRSNMISNSEIWAMWIVISLCHDLGYPIEKSSQINNQTKKIIKYFGNTQFTELDYNFSIFNTFLVEDFFNIISSKIVRPKKKESKKKASAKKIDILLKKINCYTNIQPKFKYKLSKSLEEYKHGIFSSLLLFKNLTYFLETDYSKYSTGEQNHLNILEGRQAFIRKEILRAIASHTCGKLYHIDFSTLSFLLIICDELQDWDRPNLGEVLFSKNTKQQESVIKKYEKEEIKLETNFGLSFLNNDDIYIKYLII